MILGWWSRSVRSNLPFVTTYHPLDAIGDPTRRSILEQLRRSPAAVGELARRLPVSRPAVSQHLRVLEASRLVTHEPHGTRRIYRLDERGLAEAREWLDDLWTTALDDFVRFAEETP